MNIAIFNTFAHTMSTGKIAYGLYKHLKKDNNVILFYGRYDEEPVVDNNVILVGNKLSFYIHKFGTRIMGNQGRYSYFSTISVINLLKSNKIEVVYLLNIHGNYLNYKLLFRYLIQNRIKVIYLMLDEYAFLGKCAFSLECNKYLTVCKKCPQVHEYPKSLVLDSSHKLFRIKRDFYQHIDDITFVGISYTVKKAKNSALLKEQKFIELDECIDLKTIFYPREVEKLKRKLKIEEEKIVILTVAPFTNKRKGGKYFLTVAKKLEQNKKYIFVHVGFDGNIEICPSNYIPVSYVSDQEELAEYYSLADLFVCTSYAETVADTCLEALACGTNILGFNVAGMPDAADAKHGTFVDVGDTESMCNVILKTGKKSRKDIDSCRLYAESRYDATKYFENLADIAFN